MNERTFNAIQSCEKSARAIAKRHGWDEPHFYLPHSDYEIEYWRAAEALSVFLEKVEKVDKASAQAVEDGAKTSPVPLPVHPNDKPSANFADVVGIGRENQTALYNAGYFTWEDILQAGVAKIGRDVSGIGPSRVRALFTRAQREAE